MSAILGPAIDLGPYASSAPPFDRLETIADWARSLGYTGVTLPASGSTLFDLSVAEGSQTYCDEVRGVLSSRGLALVALTTRREGALLASHPAYADSLARAAPPEARGSLSAMSAWAAEQLVNAARASLRLGLRAHVTMAGSMLGPYWFAGPERPSGIVATAFGELGRRWRGVLDAFEEAGVDVAFVPELGRDICDGVTFERLLESVGGHPRCRLVYDPGRLLRQQVDYLDFIDIYDDRLALFHVTDAELSASGRTGVLGGFLEWPECPARRRAAGDGQVDLGAVFMRLAIRGYAGWAVLDHECPIRDRIEAAEIGAALISASLVRPRGEPGEASAAPEIDEIRNRALLGLA